MLGSPFMSSLVRCRRAVPLESLWWLVSKSRMRDARAMLQMLRDQGL
jgi:hypothetical protein